MSVKTGRRDSEWLEADHVHHGDAPTLLKRIQPGSVACSVWSPPYHMGKKYEAGQTFEQWQTLLRETVAAHFDVLKPGGFLVVNIADILCFPDPSLPRIQLPNITRQNARIKREVVVAAKEQNPGLNRYQLAELLGCSEQTIDRRLNGNNIRGGKYSVQTRVQLVGHFLQEYGRLAGLSLYDRRVWVKDAAWENSQWHSSSYKAVDEFEYLYFFWKPGETQVNRARLPSAEWVEWGSRAVWKFASVRRNDSHEAKYPVELPTRVIRLLTEPGELVLDCFMGSGTTAVAALNWDRRFIGIELMPEYVKLANKNIARAREKLALFSDQRGAAGQRLTDPEGQQANGHAKRRSPEVAQS